MESEVGGNKEIYRVLWDIKASPTILFVSWRVLQDRLSTRDKLVQKRVLVLILCVSCVMRLGKQ